MIYVREDISSRSLGIPSISLGIENIFIGINLRKIKWLIGGAYIPQKHLAPSHWGKNGFTIDSYLGKYDKILFMGDFNCEMTEQAMQIFCDTYNFTNLIKSPTCFKNPKHPSCIDLMLTNMSKSFISTQVLDTGLSDHHKMCITVSRAQSQYGVWGFWKYICEHTQQACALETPLMNKEIKKYIMNRTR